MLIVTAVLLCYGFLKGFDTFELLLNIFYYSALLITQILNLIENERDEIQEKIAMRCLNRMKRGDLMGKWLFKKREDLHDR